MGFKGQNQAAADNKFINMIRPFEIEFETENKRNNNNVSYYLINYLKFCICRGKIIIAII